MKCNDSGKGDIIGLIVGAISAIFIVIVGFFYVLPEIDKATGSSLSWTIYALGIILLFAIIASLLLTLFRRG